MSENVSLSVWILTGLWFFGLLGIDLVLSRRRTGAMTVTQAVKKSAIWISLGLLFGVFIWLRFGAEAGSQYYTGFVIEKSLSVDNIFVWSALLAYLRIPRDLQYTVLYWGIIGAIFFRTIFMFGGVAIINNFQFMLIILGGVLLYTAYNIYVDDADKKFRPEDSRVISLLEKYIPVSEKLYGRKMFVREHGHRVATFLLFAICCIEITDVLFAVDSVPTVIAVVREPYIALTSNIAAILGLRALYFVFDGLKQSFWLLNKALGFILAVVGVLLILEPKQFFGHSWFGVEPPLHITLVSIVLVLVGAVVGSLYIPQPRKKYR